MKGLVITHKGIEDIAAKEIFELIGSKAEIRDSVCIFDINKLEDLCLLCYKGQSFIKVLCLIDGFTFDGFSDLAAKVRLEKIETWIGNKTYKADCSRVGEHSFTSQDVNGLVSRIIDRRSKNKIDYENPEVIVFAYVYNKEFYLGIDFAGLDLSKRDYKIFHNPRSIKGTIAYALVRIADYKTGELLMDPFCTDGTIPIEAALFTSHFPVNYYRKDKFQFLKIKELEKYDFEKADKKIELAKKQILSYDNLLKNISAAKKNAKIAGIQKQIDFARQDIEWLDTKLDKESIDKIVTHPPIITKIKEKQVKKLYSEFFYQANFVLKKGGRIVLLVKNAEIKDIAAKHSFKPIETRELWLGKEQANAITFERGN